MPKAAFDKFVESVITEYNGWLQWATIRPLGKLEVIHVRNDPTLRRRILKSRAAYKDKNKGLGEIRAKTRVVLIGCQDPDLKQLTRDSPTPTRLSEYIVLSIAASGGNKLFNGDGRLWRLWLSDAEKAFYSPYLPLWIARLLGSSFGFRSASPKELRKQQHTACIARHAALLRR